MKKMPLEAHPIANIYPLMRKKEFENLLNSIEENGYDSTQPIVLYQDKILDGRNRYKACQELEVDPDTITFEGSIEDALEESRRLNSYRRHLENDQRAMCAAYEIMASREGDGPKITVPFATSVHSVSSQRQVERAISIYKQCQEAAQSVFEGKLKIYEAENFIEEKALRLNPPEEPEQSLTINDSEIIEQVVTQEQRTVYIDRIAELEQEVIRLREDCGRKSA